MIEVKNVVKSFDGFHALDGLTMTVPKGAIYGLVGPNGAGKSTILRHLCGAYRQDSGEITLEGAPIYEQVQDGLRRLIITGAIPAGDKLPSVRALAGQLAINPNTIHRAYEALEQEGYAYSVPGKGSFAALPQDVTGKRREELLAKLDAIVQELIYLGENPEVLAARVAGKKESEPK